MGAVYSRFADRIKVILALDSGWDAAAIAEMFLITLGITKVKKLDSILKIQKL